MDIVSTPRKKGDKGVVMEGALANWYARNTAGEAGFMQVDARRIAERLKPGAQVLEIAPGPGYLAIALAKLGPYRVTGLDISHSFVRMGRENAARAGVDVAFEQGDASQMTFAANRFDFIACRAAFKNFADPLGALGEMHRVLKPGGEVLILDMRKDATNAAIDETVASMKLSRLNAVMTGFIFRHTLRDRAYLKDDFQRMAAMTPFGGCQVEEDPLSLRVWLRK